MLFDLFRNYLNALVGRNQEFEKLLAAKDISAVKERMGNRMDMAIAALKEYEVTSHEIMKREDKIITDKKGNFIRFEPVWKLPIPYQVYINEIALVFLYGRPVKWTQQSTGTDRAFQKFQDVTSTANSANASVSPDQRPKVRCFSAFSAMRTTRRTFRFECSPRAREMRFTRAGINTRI